MSVDMTVTLTVNGERHTLHVPAHEMLVETLRERLGLTGTKIGCEVGICGSCTVLVDDRLAAACLTPTARIEGGRVTTVEGLASGETLHALQQRFVERGAIQCGFCTPGMLMTTYALLRRHPDASAQEVREFIHGNYCRCTGYVKIVDACLAARDDLRKAVAS
jgi:carbon-monoxide dehydrogenase small subunit